MFFHNVRSAALTLFVFSASITEAAEAVENIGEADLTFHIEGHAGLNATTSLTGDPNIVLAQIEETYRAVTLAMLPSSNGCSTSNIVVRKEWNNMTPVEQQSFFNAMNCMNRMPARTDPRIVPGVRTRYDDFTAAHIMNTPIIHFSPWLMLWHRHFNWLFEQAMRNECGYIGGMPYGDWLRYGDLTTSGLLPALGGDGEKIDGSNCSCVMGGPFANWVVNLGPTGTPNNACSRNPQSDGLGSNPRCLERSFDLSRLADVVSVQNVASTIADSPNIDTFGPALDIGPSLHANPHSLIGGLQGGIPASSHDPWFFTHHTALDRLYSMWVAQDPTRRLGAIARADSYASLRRSGWGDAATVTLDSTLYVSPVFQNITARDVISTTDGPYCYMYD